MIELNLRSCFSPSVGQRGLAVPIINPHHPLLGTLIPACFLVAGSFRSYSFQVLWLSIRLADWAYLLSVQPSYFSGSPSLCWHTGQSNLGSSCFPGTYEALPGSGSKSQTSVFFGDRKERGVGPSVLSQLPTSFKFFSFPRNLSFSFFSPEQTSSHLGDEKNSLCLNIASKVFFRLIPQLLKLKSRGYQPVSGSSVLLVSLLSTAFSSASLFKTFVPWLLTRM